MSFELNSQWLKYHGELPDGGPVYTETNPENFIAEPWNAISSLAFLIPAIYWLWVIRGNYRHYWFLVYCAALLVAGGLGSTFFHAFRQSRFFILMDVLPIVILTLSVSILFWFKLLRKWHWVMLVLFPSFIFRYYLFVYLSKHTAINASYFLTGVLIFFPTLLLLIKNKWGGVIDVLLGVALFSLALFFRQADAWEDSFLPMGTHFLWHIMGAWGSHYIAKYIFRLLKALV